MEERLIPSSGLVLPVGWHVRSAIFLFTITNCFFEKIFTSSLMESASNTMSEPPTISSLSSSSPPHILVIPFPAQGHLLPLLDFAHILSLRHGFSITVLTTPLNLPLLRPFLSSTPSASPLILPFPDSHPSLPSHAQHVRRLPDLSFVASLIRALSFLQPQILTWARSGSNPEPVSLVLSDFFLGWTHHLAAQLGVRRVAFYSSGAFTIAAFDDIWDHMPRESADPITLSSLRSSPSFPYAHLPSIFRRYVAGDPDWEFTRESFLANRESWGAAINTFDALEGEFLAHLRESYGHDRVWAVGPLLRVSESPEVAGGAALAWLSTCPPRSVAYVCFGSQYTITEAQAHAIAAALELGGARFVWVMNGPVATLPQGFEERTKGRGLVIRGWAPQVAILSHDSVGSFMTHCGWNSVLEAIASGTAMLAWPMQADQFLTARLLVEELGLAVRVAEGAESVPDEGELGRVLAESLEEGKWDELRRRAEEMGRRAAEAVEEGGSSFKDFEELARMISEFTV